MSPENSNPTPEQKEQITDKLEQYLQKIEEGKADPLVGQIVQLEGEYVDQRVELDDKQGEEIKQLAIQFIRKISELDLEKLAQEPHLVVSKYERARDEGLGHRDLDHKPGERFLKCENPYMPGEASAQLLFLAYATKILGDFQEKFLQEYLNNHCDANGANHLSVKYGDVDYILEDEDGTTSKGTFKHANPAFVKFPEQYMQAWKRGQELRKAALECYRLIFDSENQNSPALKKVGEMGSFYGTWRNLVDLYFQRNFDGTMEVLGGIRDDAPWGYDRSFGTGKRYIYLVKNIDEQGVVHLEQRVAD